MSGQPAARVGDMHTCPQVTPGTPPVPHVGGPILPPGSPTTLICNQPAARIGDMATCVGPPDVISKGAFPVPIGNMPAARMTDQTAHGGVITQGCLTVLIGLAGTTGNPMAGIAACRAAAAGRTPPPGAPPGASGRPGQSYNNCGVESSRQIINQATGSNLTEDGLLTNAIANGNVKGPASPPFSTSVGGTSAEARRQILANNGVQSTIQASTIDNIGMATSQGRGVIANLSPSILWASTSPESKAPPNSFHAVLVTGVEYDDAGNPVNVIINDTGPKKGQCGIKVPASVWNQAVAAHPNRALNVTDNPIW